MAGNEGDLLKQAAHHAMMSTRYEGENTWVDFAEGSRSFAIHTSGAFGIVFSLGARTIMSADSLSKRELMFSSGGVSSFMMLSPAHASTSKLRRGLINAAIGNLAAPRIGHSKVHGGFCIAWPPRERIF